MQTISVRTLPQGWQWVQLGDVCEVQKGITPRIAWYADSGIRIIKFRDIANGKINWAPGFRSFVRSEYESRLRPLKVGMTLIGADAHNPEYIGKKVSFTDSIPQEPVFYAGELITIAPKADCPIAAKWPFLWFSSCMGYKAVQEKVVGVHLNSSPAKNIKIPLPPLSEQRRIVAVLDGKMAAVERARTAALERVEAVQALPAAFLREVFCFGDGELPQEWRWVTLSDICEVRRGSSITKKEVIEGSIPVIAGGQQPAYYHNQANRSGKVITVSGSGAYAGFVNFFDHPIYASDCSTLQVKMEKLIWTEFVYLAMKWQQSDIYDLKLGAAQPHVYAKDIAALKIPLPSLSDQKRIVAMLDGKITTADKARIAAEAELEAINALPAAFLRQAFDGTL